MAANGRAFPAFLLIRSDSRSSLSLRTETLLTFVASMSRPKPSKRSPPLRKRMARIERLRSRVGREKDGTYHATTSMCRRGDALIGRGATTNNTRQANAAMSARYPRMRESGSARNTPGKLEKRDPEIHYSINEAQRWDNATVWDGVTGSRRRRVNRQGLVTEAPPTSVVSVRSQYPCPGLASVAMSHHRGPS